MEYIVVCLVAMLVSALTLFSGFGLGTVLMPAFALFFPVPVAIAATAVVHLANNIFKIFLVGKKADWSVVLRFAIPGAIAAFIGAALLNLFAHLTPLYSYQLFGRAHDVTVIKAGLDKEAFIGTGTVSAVIVDAARLLVYGLSFYASRFSDLTGTWPLVFAA